MVFPSDRFSCEAALGSKSCFRRGGGLERSSLAPVVLRAEFGSEIGRCVFLAIARISADTGDGASELAGRFLEDGEVDTASDRRSGTTRFSAGVSSFCSRDRRPRSGALGDGGFDV